MIINISNQSNTTNEHNKSHINNKNNNNINSNNSDNNTELNIEKYDLIYSDFFSQGNNNILKKTPLLSGRAKESTCNSTARSGINFAHTKNTNQDSLPLSQREIKRHSKNMTKQHSKPKINEYINKKPTTINTSNDINDNNNTHNNSALINHKIDFSVGNRLYNRGFYIKNKQEEIRKKVHNECLNKMKPQLNQTNKFSNINKKPLYYNPSNYNDNSLSPIFTHKPSINVVSAKIASNLEPSSTRLLRKKKKPKQLNNSITISSKSKILINNYYEHVNMHYTKNKPCIKMNNSLNNSTDYNNSNDYNQIIPKRVNDLYVNGLLQKKKREEIYQQHIKDKNSSYKSFSYKPEQSKMSQMINEYLDYASSNNDRSSNDFYQKQIKWKLNVEKQTDKKKQELLKEDCDECTFKPMINNNTSNLNVELCENNLDEKYCNLYSGAGLDYIMKRRKNIQNKNQSLNNKEKKVNLSMKQLTQCYTKTNKDKAKNKVKYIEEMRDKFNTKEFFSTDNHNNILTNSSNIPYHDKDKLYNNFNVSGNNSNDNKEIIFQNMVQRFFQNNHN